MTAYEPSDFPITLECVRCDRGPEAHHTETHACPPHKEPMCCDPSCDQRAAWTIWGNLPAGNPDENYTEACDAHVGGLLYAGYENRIFPVTWAATPWDAGQP